MGSRQIGDQIARWTTSLRDNFDITSLTLLHHIEVRQKNLHIHTGIILASGLGTQSVVPLFPL